MKQKILYTIIIISFIVMIIDIMVFYQTSIGQIIMIFAGIICVGSYLLSDLNETLEED